VNGTAVDTDQTGSNATDTSTPDLWPLPSSASSLSHNQHV
jgi:hypothetical protein